MNDTDFAEELEKLEFNAPGVLEDVQAPEDPGPSALGKTPVVGTLRRKNDMPVLRDEVPSLTDK